MKAQRGVGVGANLPSYFSAVYISQFHFSTTFSLTGIQDLFENKKTFRIFFFNLYMSDKTCLAIYNQYSCPRPQLSIVTLSRL